MSTAVLALIAHPHERDRLIEDPTIRDSAIEEMLRYDGNAKAMMRIVAEPMELGGQQLAPGDAVFLGILAANRDPRVFERADELILDRRPNPHLAFGHGLHFCLGAALARLELRVALPRLVKRLPNLRVAGEVQWKPNISDRAASHVPLALG